MTIQPILRLFGAAACAAACAALLAACSTAERETPEPVLVPTTSTAQAEARLAAVAGERAAIEARYADREAVCYEKFFVNRCLDQAAEQRRVDLLAQRSIEIEAERYLRRTKVEERDRAMAEAEAAYQKQEAELAANPPPAKTPQSTAVAPARAKPADSRLARNRQRVQENAARDEEQAADRAANVAAYEERRRKSEQRQQEVARRVAEREAKAARRAQQEAEKANAGTPAPAPTPAR